MRELTAVLLCGGKGERLRPLTEAIPKPLVPLHGRPLVEHLVHYLAAGGVKRFVLCVGYKAELIERFTQESLAGKFEVCCVNSGDASMTDRVLDARRHFDGPALVCYGDTLANVDLAALEQQHARSGAWATLTVYPLRSPFGIVSFDASRRVVSFAEKPALPYWINIGFLRCEPAAFATLARGSDMPAFLSGLAQAGRLSSYPHAGQHLTVNTEKERAQAERQWVEFYTVPEGP